MLLSRKDFLKLSGAGVGTALALSLTPGKTIMAANRELLAQKVETKAKAVLYDGSICIGCKSCEVACRKVNELPAKDTTINTNDEGPPYLSAYTFTRIVTKEAEYDGKVRPVYIKHQCMHCLHPACAEACIVGALQKMPDGAVTYDENKCIGCRYCQVACPFGIPNFEWDKPVPWIRKCDFCAERQEEGLEPMCVAACPTGAVKFGERDELIVEARERITGANGKYINHIYGEKEVGGTSWLYLSPVPFEELGFAPHINEPVTINTARAMGLVPPVLVGVAAAMTGIYWLTKRRQELSQVKIDVEEDVEEKEGDEKQ
ncbi:4Fe-4S dicluster domain-containing protein [Chloroflexota bacterium]